MNLLQVIRYVINPPWRDGFDDYGEPTLTFKGETYHEEGDDESLMRVKLTPEILVAMFIRRVRNIDAFWMGSHDTFALTYTLIGRCDVCEGNEIVFHWGHGLLEENK